MSTKRGIRNAIIYRWNHLDSHTLVKLMARRRDEFALRTKEILGKRVGYLCSNPVCRAATVGPKSKNNGGVSIGVAAHITAASPGGPRYGPELDKSMRQSTENGIWLCQSCARLVDADEDKYTISLLQKWKTDAEKNADTRLGRPGSTDDILPNAKLELMHRTVSANQRSHIYRLDIYIEKISARTLQNFYVELVFPKEFVQNCSSHPNFVDHKSSHDFCFFRYKNTDDHEPLHPGDKKCALSIDYFVDQEIYRWHRELFNSKVCAEAFSDGKIILPVTEIFENIQEF